MLEKVVFKVGDQVQLKSGGPAMTVNSISEIDGVSVGCVWFAGSKNQKAHFAQDTLKKYTAPEKNK